ncbi:hypothetical protein ACFQU2_23770 [Siccirubricoccus deserti]
MNNRGLLLILLLVAGIAGGAMLLTRHGAADRAPEPTADAGPIGVGALGRVEPASRIRRLNQPGGFAVARLDRLLVQEGDRVEAGQLLAVFGDAAQKDAAIAQAEAAAAQSRAALARIRAAGRPEEVAAQRARIEALRAAEASARRDAERAEALVPSGAGGRAAAERARFTASRTTAERAEAEATLQRLLQPWPQDLAVAEAELAAAEAALLRARADAVLSRVVAPIAGTILKIYARPGDQVGSDGLLDLADLDRMDVVADVYETDLPRLRPARRPRWWCPASRTATRRRCARSAGWSAAPPRPAPTLSPPSMPARWRCG